MSLADFLWVLACGGYCGWLIKDQSFRRQERNQLRYEHGFGMHQRAPRNACPFCQEAT